MRHADSVCRVRIVHFIGVYVVELCVCRVYCKLRYINVCLVLGCPMMVWVRWCVSVLVK